MNEWINLFVSTQHYSQKEMQLKLMLIRTTWVVGANPKPKVTKPSYYKSTKGNEITHSDYLIWQQAKHEL